MSDWVEDQDIQLRLTLEPEPEQNTSKTVTAPKQEWEALVKWMRREFIPHEIYEEIHSLLKKINGQLAG